MPNVTPVNATRWAFNTLNNSENPGPTRLSTYARGGVGMGGVGRRARQEGAGHGVDGQQGGASVKFRLIQGVT